MSATLLMALLMQAAAVALVRFRMGRRWLERPVPLLVVTAVLYQGVSELLLAVPSIRIDDALRVGISQGSIDAGALVCSAGLLAMTVCYLLCKPERVSVTGDSQESARSARLLDWRLISLVCIPLFLISYDGGGFSQGINPFTSLSSNVAAEYLPPLITLAGVGLILRHGRRWFIPVLVVQSVLIAAIGWRGPVVVNLVALWVMLCYAGKRPTRGQLMTAGALVVAAVLVMTGSRYVVGRGVFFQNSGFAARASALSEGVTSLGSLSSPNPQDPSLIPQFAGRFDGNAYAGGIMQSMSAGDRPIGAVQAAESLLIVVPHAIWQSKDGNRSVLVPTAIAQSAFGLQNLNFPATLPAFYLGYIGPYGVIVLMALLGLVFAWGERWAFRRFSVVRLLFLAGAVMAVLQYEAGLPTMASRFRAIILLAVVAKAAEVTLPYLAAPRARLAGRSPAVPAAGSPAGPPSLPTHA